MARIRSVFPGLFTDEAFMDLTPMARLLLIGLWTEAWDDGVFEWKPRVLKARLFPADGCDVVPLLDELLRLDVVRRVERGDANFGLIRNFVRFQRPKKPTASGVTTPEDRRYLGFKPDATDLGSEPVPTTQDDDGPSERTGSEPEVVEEASRRPDGGPEFGTGSVPEAGKTAVRDGEIRNRFRTGTEPVPHRSRTGTEIRPQMEDGEEDGGEDGEEEGKNPSRQHVGAARERARSAPAVSGVWDRQAYAELERRLREAAGFEANPAAGLAMVGPIVELIGEGFDLDREILPVIRGKASTSGRRVSSWAYFVPAIREERDRTARRRPDVVSIADVVAEAKRRLGGRSK